MGLLDSIFSTSDQIKKNVKGLLSNPADYAEQMIGLLTDKAAEQQRATSAAWATRDPKKMAQQALDSSQTAMGFAPLGMLAYHGSPHKFDKFSLDKIGTGEGAQAYGHGLYLAENPEVSMQYRQAGSDRPYSADHVRIGGVGYQEWMDGLRGSVRTQTRDRAIVAKVLGGSQSYDDLSRIRDSLQHQNPSYDFSKVDYIIRTAKEKGVTFNDGGSLYKTDVPDEAVARFLDWDKPLSQQAPEVQAALGDLALKNQAHIGGTPIRQFIYDKTQQTGSLPSVVIGEIEKAGSLTAAIPALQRKFSGANDVAKGKLNELLNTLKQQEISMQTGVDYVRTGGDIVRGGYNPPEIAQMLQSKGIPGIRYLDGGSRSGGSGTSNFVAFDPELIRILERNGIPTGNQPWKAGEWQGLLGGAKEVPQSGGLLSSTWKQNDVFGTGTHIEHIGPNGKDAVIQQVAPSGKVSFYPATVKDGSVNPLNWNAFNSLEEAQSGLTGQKISESLKSRNKSLYGSIPNTWKGEERALAKKVIDEFGSAEFRQSTQSKSKYLILPSGEKIRMSDHSLPLHYEGADHEFRFGSDIADFIKQIRGGTE